MKKDVSFVEGVPTWMLFSMECKSAFSQLAFGKIEWSSIKIAVYHRVIYLFFIIPPLTDSVERREGRRNPLNPVEKFLLTLWHLPLSTLYQRRQRRRQERRLRQFERWHQRRQQVGSAHNSGEEEYHQQPYYDTAREDRGNRFAQFQQFPTLINVLFFSHTPPF